MFGVGCFIRVLLLSVELLIPEGFIVVGVWGELWMGVQLPCWSRVWIEVHKQHFPTAHTTPLTSLHQHYTSPQDQAPQQHNLPTQLTSSQFNQPTPTAYNNMINLNKQQYKVKISFFSYISQMRPKILKDLFIGGKFVKATRGQTFDVINPMDASVIANVQRGSNEDIDLAVKVANQAFQTGPWARMDPSERMMCLLRLADLVDKNADELAALQSINNGKPAHIAKMVDVNVVSRCLRYYAGWADKIRGNTINMDGPFFAYTKRQPVGVVGQVIPWNFPLVMQAWKLAPALAAGCSIVMKTAEQTPLTGLRIAELIQEAGIPAGVVNIISGFGDIGAYLVRHPGINKVAFTGSTEVGYDIMRNSHEKNLKRVTLQLGGKSANIITKNANLETALQQASLAVFFNAGQCCNAGSRTYVHSSLYDKYLSMVVENAKKIKLGNPLDPDTDQGPLVSKEQFDRVMRYIDLGVKEGARLVTGGKRHGTKGYFVEPTVFADVTDNMTIAKEEIFGPVMSVLKFDQNEDVLKRANSSAYGLAAAVVSEDLSELNYFIDGLKAGSVYANCYHATQTVTPFGGYKDSGLGRELGEEGLNNYLQTKTVIMKK